MNAEIAVLQAEADALRRTIIDAVRGLIERQPDLIVRIDGVFHRSFDSAPVTRAGFEEIGSMEGPIDMRLSVDVGVTGR